MIGFSSRGADQAAVEVEAATNPMATTAANALSRRCDRTVMNSSTLP
jgi:hypothetical protein